MIPSSVREINDGAFMSCVQLKSVELAPNSFLDLVGFRAFAETGLKQICIPRGTEVNNSAFANCYGINVFRYL